MPNTKGFPLLPFCILLLGGVAIGTTGIFMRYSDVNVFASAFWRMALAVPLLWILAYAARHKDKERGKNTNFGKVLYMVGIYFAADMGILHLSLSYTTVSNATLLANFAPVLIALFMWKVYHVRFARIYVIGTVVAIIGAIVLIGPNAAVGGTKLLGDLLALVAACCYAGYQLMVKAARIHYSPERLMAASTTITALALLPFALLWNGPFWPATLFNWWPLIALALVAQIGGQSAISYASAHLPASLSSISLMVQPASAAVAAMFLFNEIMSPVQAFGALILMFGIFLGTRGHRGH